VKLGGYAQVKDTEEVYRLVSFELDPTADIDFAVKLIVHEVAGSFLAGTYLVCQDYSDSNGVPAGLNVSHTIDVSASTTDQYGYIQVAGEGEVTNHDGTCPLGTRLETHAVDGGTTDVGDGSMPLIGWIVSDAGSTTPVARLCIGGVVQPTSQP